MVLKRFVILAATLGTLLAPIAAEAAYYANTNIVEVQTWALGTSDAVVVTITGGHKLVFNSDSGAGRSCASWVLASYLSGRKMNFETIASTAEWVHGSIPAYRIHMCSLAKS